jgi:hypothetical protein
MDKRDFLRTLVAEVGQSELYFQTHAAVTLRVRQALDDPDISVAAAARFIQAEPVLAARVVAVSNSVAFRGAFGQAISDVRSAVTRLGFRNVRALATAFLVRQVGASAGTGHPQVRQMAAQLWEHTAHVTALAHMLARHVTHVDSDIALFTGLVHEVGGFYLLSRAADYPGLFEDDPADWNEADVLELLNELDRAVLLALTIPQAAMTAMEAFWQGFLAMPPHSLSDTLLLAEDLSPIASPFHEAKAASKTDGGDVETGAAASIEMILGAETLSAVLKESAEEVDSLAGALQL